MQKAAAQVILGKSRYHKALSTQQNREIMGRKKLFSVPGSFLIKTTLLKSQAKELYTWMVNLSKQVQWTLAYLVTTGTDHGQIS